MENKNMKLEVGKVYIGKFHDEPCIYLGKEKCEDSGEIYHQFEKLVIKPEDVVIGHGQTDEQVIKEEYTLCKSGHILYGKT